MVKVKDLKKVDRPLEKHIGDGHRKRLRDRFLQSGLDGFLDYEIIELLLTLGTPRKDCKQIAKELIEKFGGLRNVLDTPIEELQKIKGTAGSINNALSIFIALSNSYLLQTQSFGLKPFPRIPKIFLQLVVRL